MLPGKPSAQVELIMSTGIGEAAPDAGLTQEWPRESDASAKETRTVAYRPPRVVSAGDRPDVQDVNAKCTRLWVSFTMLTSGVPV